jgi:hypothetical protein
VVEGWRMWRMWLRALGSFALSSALTEALVAVAAVVLGARIPLSVIVASIFHTTTSAIVTMVTSPMVVRRWWRSPTSVSTTTTTTAFVSRVMQSVRACIASASAAECMLEGSLATSEWVVVSLAVRVSVG